MLVGGGVPVVVADEAGEVVEEVALLPGDAALIVVMGPWGDDEQAALGTCFELPAARFLHGCKAVFYEDNHGVSGLEGAPHDFFLSWTDAGGDEDRSATGKVEEMATLGFDIALGEGA